MKKTKLLSVALAIVTATAAVSAVAYAGTTTLPVSYAIGEPSVSLVVDVASLNFGTLIPGGGLAKQSKTLPLTLSVPDDPNAVGISLTYHLANMPGEMMSQDGGSVAGAGALPPISYTTTTFALRSVGGGSWWKTTISPMSGNGVVPSTMDPGQSAQLEAGLSVSDAWNFANAPSGNRTFDLIITATQR